VPGALDPPFHRAARLPIVASALSGIVKPQSACRHGRTDGTGFALPAAPVARAGGRQKRAQAAHEARLPNTYRRYAQMSPQPRFASSRRLRAHDKHGPTWARLTAMCSVLTPAYGCGCCCCCCINSCSLAASWSIGERRLGGRRRSEEAGGDISADNRPAKSASLPTSIAHIRYARPSTSHRI
jgi:hypothetical protein